MSFFNFEIDGTFMRLEERGEGVMLKVGVASDGESFRTKVVCQ